MMMLLLAKRRNPCSIILPCFTKPLLTRFISASPTQNPDPKSPHFSVVDYLVTSFGLSGEKAARISKPIAYLKSPEKPDAVRRFLGAEGFTEPEIKTIVTLCPPLLCLQEKAIETNLRALRAIGLSSLTLNQIILSQPKALQLRSAATRIMFWMGFFGGNHADLLKAFRYNGGIIGLDINKSIASKVALLKSHGLNTTDVCRIVLSAPRFIMHSECIMEEVLTRAKDWGFKPNSKMFACGLNAISCLSREKMELLKSYGWSDDELLSALHKMPVIAALTENNLQNKMTFFTGEVKCEPSYIASNPTLLLYSLEKRLRPRHNVLRHLETKGLSTKRLAFYTVMLMPDDKFVERFIVPHKDNIPGLHEAFVRSLA